MAKDSNIILEATDLAQNIGLMGTVDPLMSVSYTHLTLPTKRIV